MCIRDRYLAIRCGLQEIFTYPWMDEQYVNAILQDTTGILSLSTPPSPTEKMIRSSLLPNLCKAVVKNERYFTDFSLFETAQDVYKRQGHGLVAFHRRHRPDTLRHPQKHQSRPGTHRPTAGKYRRSGIAHAAAQTQHLTEGTLVALRVPARQQPPHKLPADGLGLPLIRHDPPSRIVNSEASIPHFLQKTHPLPILRCV